MTMLPKIILSAILLFALSIGAKYLFGGKNLETAYLLQGLSISTDVKYLVEEHWGNFGELPCKAGQLDYAFLREKEKAHSVLSAIDITDCGQVTLLYNEDSGVPGRRMVLQAEEKDSAMGIELTWRCWTPDFPDIEDRISRCQYENRQLAEVLIPDAAE